MTDRGIALPPLFAPLPTDPDKQVPVGGWNGWTVRLDPVTISWGTVAESPQAGQIGGDGGGTGGGGEPTPPPAPTWPTELQAWPR